MFDFLVASDEVHAVFESELFGQAFCRFSLRAVSDHQQPRRQVTGKTAEGLHHVLRALDPAKVGQVTDEKFVWPCVFRPQLGVAAVRVEAVEIDEVVNDFGGAVRAELFLGLSCQVARDGSETVALADTESRDLVERLVEAEQSDVCAVERRNDLGTFAVEHLLGEVRARGVRDRVVGVQDVDRVLSREFGELCRQGQGVGRVLKQRITRDRDLVEVHARLRVVHANGPEVADDVDVVSALRQAHAKLGGDDAAASDGRMTDDGDA